MYGTVVQDWITIRGATGLTSVTQSEQSWLSFQTSEDIVLILDCRETSGTFTSITINFETAPTKDEILFMPMQTGLNMATSPGTPQVEWDGNAWTEASTSGPSARQRAACAAVGNKIVLFGGNNGPGTMLSDT